MLEIKNHYAINAGNLLYKTLSVALALTASVVTTRAADAADEASRRWAVIAGMSLAGSTTVSYDRASSLSEKPSSFGSPMGNVLLEYYIPRTHFSVVGGYNAETLEWYGSDVSATMHNVVLGARYYPLSTRFAIQPYASLLANSNVSSRKEHTWMGCIGGGYSYERNYTVTCPRLSVAPAVGFDCYIFSSLALEFQYGFPLAINGKAHVATTYDGKAGVYRLRSNMHRHNIQIGLKATFPFHFTSADGNSLFKLLYIALGIYDPDEDNKNENRRERKRENLNRVLNSY